jgi:hypothetical protein
MFSWAKKVSGLGKKKKNQRFDWDTSIEGCNLKYQYNGQEDITGMNHSKRSYEMYTGLS